MALDKAGRYELLEEVGRGAMGVVYRARDPLIGRTVAVKTLRLAEFQNEKNEPGLLELFQNEIRAAGRLTHPNIVVIHDAGVDREADVFYITMEYVNGKSLQTMLEEKQAFPIPRVLRIMEQACRALEYAHVNHIVHRDIKPGNMLVGELDSLKITDFGTAKILERGGTQSGQVIGTPSYMAPEQVKGRPVDGRADVFALAVILYELLTGERPFPGKNVTTVIYKIVHEEPIAPIHLDSSIHPGLNAIILKGLAKEPAQRYQSCQEFLAALRNYRETAQSTAATVVRRVPVLPNTRPVIAGQTVVPPRGTPPQPDTPAQFAAAHPIAPANSGLASAAPRTASTTTGRGVAAAVAAAASRAAAAQPNVAPPVLPSPPMIVRPPAAPERRSHVGLLSFLLLLAVAGASGYLYWPQVQAVWQRAAVAVGIASEPPKPVQTAVADSQGRAAGAASPAASPAQPAGSPVANPPAVGAAPGAAVEFPAKLVPARDRMQAQLQKLGLADRVQIAAAEDSLVLSGQLTAAEHRALFRRLPALPGKPRVLDKIEVQKPVGEGASVAVGAAPAGKEPRKPERSWPAADKGALDVTSDEDGAQVSLHTPDGSAVAECRTPCRFADLVPGQYKMTVRVAGYPPLERLVTIHAGTLGQERLRLTGGKNAVVGAVQVLSVPVGADIVINGHSTGRQTPARIELPPGTYTVTLYRKGYAPFEKKVTVQQSRTAELQAVLAHP